MTNKYTVLRVLRGVGTLDPFAPSHGSVGKSVGGFSGGPPEAQVEVEQLTPNDIRDLNRDPSIAAIAPTMPTKLIEPLDAGAPAAAAAAAQPTAWGVTAVGADRSPYDGDGVVVAVLDTGIDAAHPAFQGVHLVQRDFSGSGDGDRTGHGTHCAGTIFGRDVDGKRIGVARGVKTALIGKVLNDKGKGDSNWIFKAMMWALGEDAHVISMSLGFDFPGLVKELELQGLPTEVAASAALDGYRGNLRLFDALMQVAAARAAFNGGALVVAAAGNESRRDRTPPYEVAASLPAAASGVIAVGALERTGDHFAVADFSNTLPDISAPGVGILSAKRGGGLRMLSGTSQAAPHVAGVAALWWQALGVASTLVKARNVSMKLLTQARANVFAQSVDAGDRGAGLVTAPS